MPAATAAIDAVPVFPAADAPPPANPPAPPSAMTMALVPGQLLAAFRSAFNLDLIGIGLQFPQLGKDVRVGFIIQQSFRNCLR